MKFSDLIYVTIQNLRNRKSRIFFTILGVAVAIAAVFSLVAFGYGLQKSLLEKITTADSLLTFDAIPADPDVIRLNEAVVRKIAAIPNVDKTSPRASFSAEIAHNGIISGISANIINPDFLLLQGVAPMVGRFFKAGDVKKIVVTSVVAQLLDLKPEEALGKTVTLTIFPQVVDTPPEPSNGNGNGNGNGKSAEATQVYFGEGYEIVGVLESQSSEGEAYIQKSDSAGITIREYKMVKVKAVSTEAMKGIRDNLIGSGFLVSALSDIVEEANKIFRIVQVALGVFGVIALVVAAIGLINTMTIALLERTNEIGVMRAIGASQEDIRRLFLGESTLIGFLGGIGGILIGFIVSESLNWVFNFVAASFHGNVVRLFSYPLWFTVFIILLSTIVGFFGGLWPAYRAAKMNPLKALKYK